MNDIDDLEQNTSRSATPPPIHPILQPTLLNSPSTRGEIRQIQTIKNKNKNSFYFILHGAIYFAYMTDKVDGRHHLISHLYTDTAASCYH